MTEDAKRGLFSWEENGFSTSGLKRGRPRSLRASDDAANHAALQLPDPVPRVDDEMRPMQLRPRGGSRRRALLRRLRLDVLPLK